jgi:hypothetical protein
MVSQRAIRMINYTYKYKLLAQIINATINVNMKRIYLQFEFTLIEDQEPSFVN